MTWKVAGTALDSGPVVVTVESGSVAADENSRTQVSNLLHGRQRRHRLGVDLPSYTFTFWFHGPAPQRYARMQAMRTTLNQAEAVLIEAPAAPNDFYFDGGVKSLLISVDGLRIVYGAGISAVGLEVRCTHLDPDAQQVLGLSNVILQGLPVFTISKTAFLVLTDALNRTATVNISAAVELVIVTPINVTIPLAANGRLTGNLAYTGVTPSTTYLSFGIVRTTGLTIETTGFTELGPFPVNIDVLPAVVPDNESFLNGAPVTVGTPATAAGESLVYDGPLEVDLAGAPVATPTKVASLDGIIKTATLTPTRTPTLTVT